jgi:hypothetical protein
MSNMLIRSGAVQPSKPRPRSAIQPGDLVTTASGYPLLYEVLRLEGVGRLRVRGQNWAAGYSAEISAQAVRPVAHILATP